jgi:hypothetical protein
MQFQFRPLDECIIGPPRRTADDRVLVVEQWGRRVLPERPTPPTTVRGFGGADDASFIDPVLATLESVAPMWTAQLMMICPPTMHVFGRLDLLDAAWRFARLRRVSRAWCAAADRALADQLARFVPALEPDVEWLSRVAVPRWRGDRALLWPLLQHACRVDSARLVGALHANFGIADSQRALDLACRAARAGQAAALAALVRILHIDRRRVRRWLRPRPGQ